MSTEGISLNIVENSTSDKLMKGDSKKAWERLERFWNPKTREDKVEFYTKLLNYKLENARQRPMDWLAFLERKKTELVNTGHIVDNETFITHLELDQYKNDLVINQHIMQMIDTDIFWYEKTFRAILMELQNIRHGEMIAQTSEEHSEN